MSSSTVGTTGIEACVTMNRWVHLSRKPSALAVVVHKNLYLNSTFPSDYTVFGALVNKTPFEITNLDVRTTVVTNSLGQSTDLLNFHLLGEDKPDSTFGCLRVEGLGNFTPSTVKTKANTSSGATYWSWTISKECAGKTGVNFAQQVDVKVDTRLYSTVKTMSSAFNNNQAYSRIRKGYSIALTGSGVHPALGSLVNKTFNGKNIYSVVAFHETLNNTYKLDLYISGETASDFFDYIEIEGKGRFYASEATRLYDPSVTPTATRFHWPLSQEKWESFPSVTTNINFQIV